MAPSAIDDAPAASGRNSPKPPPARIWNVSEPPFEGYRSIDTDGYARSNGDTAIIIDNGTNGNPRTATCCRC
jgi:actin-related protein 5